MQVITPRISVLSALEKARANVGVIRIGIAARESAAPKRRLCRPVLLFPFLFFWLGELWGRWKDRNTGPLDCGVL